jgi:sirohydrochlorin ferrochelatase
MSSPALVAASHGTSDPAGRRTISALCAAVAGALPDVMVHPCFVDVQQPDVPTTIAGLPSREIAVVVPLLLSAGYHVHHDLAQDAAAAEHEVVVAGALGPDARLARILARRLDDAGLLPGDRVVLAAAGSSDLRAVADCARVGELLADELGRPVSVGYLSAAEPRLADAVSAARAADPGARVLVASYLLAPGYFAGLVHEAGGDVVSHPLLVDGAPVPPELVDVIVDRYLARIPQMSTQELR